MASTTDDNTHTPGTATPGQVSMPEVFRVEDDSLVLDGVSIGFQRTLRVSEQGTNWLPPSLGSFPLRTVDPVAHRLPEAVAARGGVLLPLYVREALWINFSADEPVAIQIGTVGRRNSWHPASAARSCAA